MKVKDNNFIIAGIDFGAKKSGNTAICLNNGIQLTLFQAQKGEDADRFLSAKIKKVELIGIDAPLSLPKVYSTQGSDFFYRLADRQLGAMSPMFLGALTARAIQFSRSFDCPVIEVYPAARMRRHHHFKIKYKKDLTGAIEELKKMLTPFSLQSNPQNWHQFDAILAWWITYDYHQGKANQSGDVAEGIIYY